MFTARTLRQTGAVALHVHEGAGAPGGTGTASGQGTARAMDGRDGSGSVRDDPQYRVETALGGTVRPWTVHRYYDWRSRSFVAPYQVD